MVDNDVLIENRIVSAEDKVIASKLYRVRTRMDIERVDLAKVSGISEQSIAEYENGIEPVPASDLFILSHIMGISIDYFYNDEILGASSLYQSDEAAVFSS